MSHAQSAGQKISLKGLGGASPSQFLVFMAINELEKTYGKAKMLDMLSDAKAAYKKRMFPHFQAVRIFGPEGTIRLYEDMLHGRQKSESTYICSLWPQELNEPNLSKL